jgi:hypothetical protein
MLHETLDNLRSRLNRWLRTTIAEVHEVRGFTVVVENTRPDIATADVLARLDEALAMIEAHRPWRLRHMRRDIRQLRIARYPCRGAYFLAERICLTELTFLARRDITPAPVAASILHEGMHARMHAMGVQHGDANAARMERICRRAEREFGYALPASLGAPVIERALTTLELEDEEVAPEVDWNEALRRQRAVDQAALLRRPGGPA